MFYKSDDNDNDLNFFTKNSKYLYYVIDINVNTQKKEETSNNKPLNLLNQKSSQSQSDNTSIQREKL
jgi:hypothetical protein